MRQFLTEIRAIDPIDGELKSWSGPIIKGVSIDQAKAYCKDHLGYCRVIGELIEEIPVRRYTPIWEDSMSYENLN